MNQRPPNPVKARYVEWRAERIADPVRKLRFLRRSSGALATGEDARKMRWHWIRVGCIILCSGFAVMPMRHSSFATADRLEPVAPAMKAQDVPVAADSVWMVSQNAAYEDYSNGLRIEKQYTVANAPRTRYRVFERERPNFERFTWKSGVSGIVYHTTESHVAPFEPAKTGQQTKASQWTLADIQKRRCYHYVIDRYGRVWRVVDEDSIAWHAGRSVWGDPNGTFVDLNDSFIGVSFEAQTYDQSQPTATEAQIRAARVLTEMLRSKYRIPAYDCVTHAQVSVSAQSMLAGAHTDWAANFPFVAMGLPDNYNAPMASVWAFGFDYDSIFVNATGNRLWQGLIYAEQHVREQATLAGLTVPQYKQLLQGRYKQLIQALSSADEEPTHER